MKIVVIGGTGTIGKEVVKRLKKEHEVIAVGKNSGDYQLNIENKASIERLFTEIQNIDGVISLAGDAILGAFHEQADEHIDLAINSKIRANINLVRVAINNISSNGFIILTTGSASHTFVPGASSVTMANLAIEGYVRAIQIERFNDIRINVVSPTAVKETLARFNMELPNAVSAKQTANVYKAMVDTKESGIIANVLDYIG